MASLVMEDRRDAEARLLDQEFLDRVAVAHVELEADVGGADAADAVGERAPVVVGGEEFAGLDQF
jgi:hypothetical protein